MAKTSLEGHIGAREKVKEGIEVLVVEVVMMHVDVTVGGAVMLVSEAELVVLVLIRRQKETDRRKA